MFEAERQREADMAAWTTQRAQWLRLAKGVGAPEDRRGRIAARPVSAESVADARALYLAAAAKDRKEAARMGAWDIAARIGREEAMALYREAGSPVPVPDEIAEIHANAMSALLRSLKGTGTHAEIVGGSCCAACRADDGRAFAIAEELRHPRLPHRWLPPWALRLRVVDRRHAPEEAAPTGLGIARHRGPTRPPRTVAADTLESGAPSAREHAAMQNHAITMLGTGLIGDFYTMTLHGQRGRDRVRVVYSRSEDRGRAFSERWGIPEFTTDMEAAIRHPETDVVVVALPNHLHEEAVKAVAAAGKAVLCTKPLGRTADEAQPDARGGRGGRRVRRVPRGPVLHAQDAQGDQVRAGGRAGRRDLGPLPRDASRARTAPGSGTAG